MTDKELKHLSRAELIDIIYELQTFEQSFTLPDGTQLKIESRRDDRDGR